MDEQDRRYGGLFFDERVDVTGKTFVNGFFNRCVVERRPTDAAFGPTTLYGCVFERCEFIGDGWPDGWGTRHAMPNGLAE